MASLLAVANVFIGLWTLILFSGRCRGGEEFIHTRPMQELELKMQGGIIVGFYNIILSGV